MQELKNFLDLAQHYWAVTIAAAIFIHLIFSRRKGSQSSIEIKPASIEIKPAASLISNLKHSNFQPGLNIQSTKFEFTSADPAFGPVIKALKKGDKITAIKLLREARDLSLTDAKAFAETLDVIKHTFPDRGFTLIELLVVVAIIGILAAIAIPQFSSYRVRSFNSSAQTDLRNAIAAQEAAMLDREAYWDCMNSGCNHPALPGMRVSPGVSIACTPRNNGEIFQCSTRHNSGTITYYFDSENAVFWEH